MQHLEVSKLQQLKLVKDKRQRQKLPSSNSYYTSSLPLHLGAAPLSPDRKMKEKDTEREMSGKTRKKAEWM